MVAKKVVTMLYTDQLIQYTAHHDPFNDVQSRLDICQVLDYWTGSNERENQGQGDTCLSCVDQNKFPSTLFSFPCHFYRPQRSCGQGNVFTGVCDSVHRGRVSASVHVGIPHSPGSRHPPLEQTPPWEQTPPQSRHTPLEQTPPWEQTPPPPKKQAPVYGQ